MFEKEIEELNKAIKHLENDILPSKCNGNISCYNEHLQLYRWIEELKSYKEIQAKNNEDIFEDYAEKWWQNEYSPHTYANSKKVWKDGAEFGYNKANEWHYVKDGDLPKENKICLLYLGSSFNPITGWIKDGIWYFENDIKNGVWQSNVIAWKEIVLPKEIKEK